MKFENVNGSFDVIDFRESRSYSGNKKFKNLQLTADGAEVSVDTIEDIITEPEMITAFRVIADNNFVVGDYSDYVLDNISKQVIDGSISILVNFSKE